MLNRAGRFQKRLFDVVLSAIGICLTWWIILAAWMIASVETRSNGLFMQKRIGKEGKPFFVFKIKSMKQLDGLDTTVTTSQDRRITKSGTFFRRSKIDELPQLFNVLLGDMSFVGPRPDVPGYADGLRGEDRIILSVRPGITGPASLKYKNEEEILSKVQDPERYNREVIWPDKVEINKQYIQEWSLLKDMKYLVQTVAG
ncbi:sugar transferase [Sulfurovum sp. NBC37-1]|uniref:sugar transferase n=1 Tax=Sulfurovum sp. (strain NBC37-1) TaxID=387093 RepID=UPI0001587841|nr:sugar transferase [Sulfurovum sp. NBC37-1]BAF71064.1 undecaprenyl-phosphate galactose phosphotransferase [Sulfurovum sp. NBC37-1]